MPGPIQRSTVVKFFGTPDRTEGSLNEPRERHQEGFTFNEMWVYKRPVRDPAGAAERAVLWRRYDFVGSLVRRSKDGDWEADAFLASALGGGS